MLHLGDVFIVKERTISIDKIRKSIRSDCNDGQSNAWDSKRIKMLETSDEIGKGGKLLNVEMETKSVVNCY